jgi:UDP-2,3-diacylglucosamine pyrophosphatase LpxH
MKKVKFVLLILSGLLIWNCAVPFIQTFPITDKNRTNELLDIHYGIAKTERKTASGANYLFLSDLHRGYGPHDRFAPNDQCYKKLLHTFYDAGFSLVLIGDIDEGWGFQRNNVPLIQKSHNQSDDIEEKFMEGGRFIGIYGNHDDYLRGNFFYTGNGKCIDIHPAAVIDVTWPDESHEQTLITHGCQGQGLHDAGDDLAAWGVFEKYNYLMKQKNENLDITDEDLVLFQMYYHIYDSFSKHDLPGKRDKNVTLDRADKIWKGFSLQERHVLDWAQMQAGITNIVFGHTHHAVCNSRYVQYEKKFQNQKLMQIYLDETVLYSASAKLTNNMLTYYNTGMACNKEIPFLVMAKGKFHFFYVKKEAADKPYTHVEVDSQGRETDTPMSEAEFEEYL